MDIREQNVPFSIPNSSLVSWEYQITTFKITEATHHAKAFLEIVLVDVRWRMSVNS